MSLPIWAADYVGLPFKEHGRDRAGLDCWGLVRLVYAERYGIELPSLVERYDNTLAANALQLGAIVAEVSQEWMPVPAGQEREGDVIVLRYNRHPMHVGLVLKKNMMLHVEQGIEASVCCYDSLRYRRAITGFYRHANR